MTVPSETNKSGPYYGDGVTTVFNYDFRIVDKRHLRVILTDESTGIEHILTVDTDYIVTGVGDAGGGQITVVSPLAVGKSLTILRAVPFKQEIDLENQGAYYAETVEEGFDLSVMRDQELSEQIGRALKLPKSAPSGVDLQLPRPDPRKLLGWNEAGSGLDNYGTEELATLVAYGEAQADIFEGDGATTEFPLTKNPVAQANLDVSVSGVTQLPGVDYEWTGGLLLRFFTPPPNGAKILARYLQGLPFGDVADGSITDSKLSESVAVQALPVAATPAALLASTAQYTVGSTIRTANGFIYEVADSDATDADLTTAGGVRLRLIAPDYVTPEMLGGDLHKAGEYAAKHGVLLITPAKDYEITSAFCPHDITWISNNTRIKQMRLGTGGDNPLDSVLYPGNNVKHIGRTYLYLEDRPGGGAAYRAHVLCGRWDTGDGIHNFHFDEFVLEGGHNNCNGFSVAGNSHNIRGRRIDAGASTKIGRVFMAHWANFNDHYNQGGVYQHTPGATPTTHPYDIQIEEVVGDIELSTSDFCALWCVSAGYDIRVGRVEGRVVNHGVGGGNLVLLTAGDLGLAYATADELAHGMRGLEVGVVVGQSSQSAVRRIGLALYYNADSTPQPAENYFVKIQDTIGIVDAECTTDSNLHCGVDGHNGRGASRYDHIKVRRYKSASNCSNYTRDFSAELIEAIDCQNMGIQLVGSGVVESDWPTNISIGTIKINGTGLSETTSGQSVGSNINKIQNLHIGTIIIDKLKDMPTFGSASLSIGADVRGITIDNIHQNWVGTGQVFCVSNSATADRFVDIGHIRAPAGLEPVSGGVTSRVIGRNREYHYFGGAIPSGITVRVGDRFVAASATVGQPWISIVTTAGVTGSGAVVTPYLVRV